MLAFDGMSFAFGMTVGAVMTWLGLGCLWLANNRKR